jgi:hypothetical protein
MAWDGSYVDIASLLSLFHTDTVPAVPHVLEEDDKVRVSFEFPASLWCRKSDGFSIRRPRFQIMSRWSTWRL